MCRQFVHIHCIMFTQAIRIHFQTSKCAPLFRCGGGGYRTGYNSPHSQIISEHSTSPNFSQTTLLLAIPGSITKYVYLHSFWSNLITPTKSTHSWGAVLEMIWNHLIWNYFNDLRFWFEITCLFDSDFDLKSSFGWFLFDFVSFLYQKYFDV